MTMMAAQLRCHV